MAWMVSLLSEVSQGGRNVRLATRGGIPSQGNSEGSECGEKQADHAVCKPTAVVGGG